MVTGNSKRWLGVFFCSIGCICSTSALGAEGDSGAIPGAPTEPPALFEASSGDEDLPHGQQVEVGSFGQIDLHVKDLELTKVLQLLSIQSQRNIIASRNVAGAVSADLYGVDFYEALDAILHTNGFGYREKGQFIYVYTTEEIAQLEDENRELVYEIVRLNYINAADASAFATPLLSSNGSIALSGEPDDGFQPTLSDGGANGSAHQDTLIIRDYAENVEEIIEIIKQLDTQPKQVLVEATILQARLTEANAFGVDFAVFADLNLTDFTTPLGAVDELITGGPGFNSGSAVTTSPGNVSKGASSVKFGVVGSDAAVFVRALDSVTDTTVLAKPQVLVLNRQKVDLLVGERLGYLSTTATETSNTQTVEFLDVGTQLTLRPFISDDDFVRMEIRPSVSDGSTSLVGGFVIPDTTTQEIVSNVIVKSGQTIVLGGLFKEDTTIGRTNVPGLGNLPLVGGAFKGQDDSVTRSEVIFMIKPTIQKVEDLTKQSDSVLADIDATRIGMREGLMPWSRTKLTSSYVRDAIKYMGEGNNDKALWSLDKALYLDPTMADATRLKGQITGEKTYFYDRSILKRTIDATIDAELTADAEEVIESDGFELEEFTGDTPEDEVSTTEDFSIDAGLETGEEASAESTDWQVIETIDDGTWTSQQEDSNWSDTDESVEASEIADPSAEADSDWVEPTANFDEQDEAFSTEFDEQAEATTSQFDGQAEAFPFTDPATEAQFVPNRDETQAEVESPWRVELTGEEQEASAWQDQQGDEFSTSDESSEEYFESDSNEASVEIYDPNEFFVDDEQEAIEDDGPVNIFDFVQSQTGGSSTEDQAATGSEAELSSVDTEQTE